jgi:hypothetical protein
MQWQIEDHLTIFRLQAMSDQRDCGVAGALVRGRLGPQNRGEDAISRGKAIALRNGSRRRSPGLKMVSATAS